MDYPGLSEYSLNKLVEEMGNINSNLVAVVTQLKCIVDLMNTDQYGQVIYKLKEKE